MAALKNAKHEKYASAIASGKSATEAMEAAGYSDPRNSTRLTKNDEIQSRIAELQNKAAERTVITVASITDRLLSIATKAEVSSDAPLLSVARAALMDAAKLNGLVVEKSLSAQTSVEDLLDQLDGKAG